MPAERDQDELGALWERKSQKGELMMTGTIDGIDVVCFLVKRTSEKSPTWRVLRSRPRTEAPAHEPRATAPRAVSRQSDITDDDIPF